MDTGNHTILLVEDDQNDVALIQRACRKARLANPLYTMADGEAAIAYLDGQPPYDDRRRFPIPVLVLLDLKLPRKSGFEVLKVTTRRFVVALPAGRRSDILRRNNRHQSRVRSGRELVSREAGLV